MKIFTDQDISEFCTVTEDSNKIHNPIWMSEQNRYAIVPGMYTLTLAVNHAALYFKKTKSAEIYLGKFQSSGDSIYLKCYDKDTQIRISASDKSGLDFFSYNNNYSYLSTLDNGDVPLDFNGKTRYFPITYEQTDHFGQIINSNDKDISSFLFIIAYASHVLSRSLVEPQTKNEKMINKIFNNDKGLLYPAYQLLQFEIPHGIRNIDYSKLLYYTTEFENNENRITAYIRCEQDDILYASKFSILPISEKLILRLAKTFC